MYGSAGYLLLEADSPHLSSHLINLIFICRGFFLELTQSQYNVLCEIMRERKRKR